MRLILRYVRPYLARLVGGMSSKFLGTLMDLCIPGVLSLIINEVALAGNVNELVKWALVMLLCSVFALVGNVVANRVAASVARDAVERVRHDLFTKVIRLSNRDIDRFTIPSLISRMTTDTYYVYRMIGMMQRIGIRAPILLVGGIIMTMLQDTRLASLLLVMLPFMALVVIYISKKGVPLYANLQTSVDKMVRVVRENASGVRIIKALSKTEDEKARFAQVNEEVAAGETKAASVMAVNSPTMRFLLNVGLVLVVWLGASRVNAGVIAVGTIVAFVQYFNIILNAMMTITRVLTMYSKALASARRIEEVLQAQDEGATEKLPAGEQDNAHIRFADVSFSYNKRSPDVAHIDFALARGQSLGILGPTGAGKSTVVKLLLRFFDPDTGSVSINGQDIRTMTLEELRTRFGVVFQNDTLFRGTIEQNITLGRAISTEDIDRAILDAQAEPFIQERGGTSVAVETRGMNFSGGQQQRLLIARALAGTPEILILDDSSSALDFKTEAMLRLALNQREQKPTTIIIAQRISAIMHCDLIMVLEDGEVKGLGTHERLLRECPLYHEIASLQLGGDDDE